MITAALLCSEDRNWGSLGYGSNCSVDRGGTEGEMSSVSLGGFGEDKEGQVVDDENAALCDRRTMHVICVSKSTSLTAGKTSRTIYRQSRALGLLAGHEGKILSRQYRLFSTYQEGRHIKVL